MVSLPQSGVPMTIRAPVSFGGKMNDEMTGNGQVEIPEDPEPLGEIDITEVVTRSPVLARLVEEVRNEQAAEPQAYNRMHNRHNRSR